MAKKRKVRVFVIKPTGPYVAEVVNYYVDFKRELGFDSPIDIIERKIGGKTFSIVVDDEGLFKEEADGRIKAIGYCKNANEILAGNIMIMKYDSRGYSRNLTDNDIELIKQNVYTFPEDVTVDYQTNLGSLKMYFNALDPLIVYEV